MRVKQCWKDICQGFPEEQTPDLSLPELLWKRKIPLHQHKDRKMYFIDSKLTKSNVEALKKVHSVYNKDPSFHFFA